MLIERELINTLEQGLLAMMILIIMFGMGASLTAADFRAALQRPRGILIGFLSQFGFMPLLALGLAVLFELPPAQAIALILVGCLPGGATSNMFTYFARGSVALSISMTAASTFLALFLLPVLLELYAAGFALRLSEAMREQGSDAGFVIPRVNIIVSLLLVLIPVAGGMILRRFSPGWAKAAEDTASFTAFIVILFLITSVTLRHGDLFLRTPLVIYLCAIGLGLAGFSIGYGFSMLFRLAPRYRRAISLETGIQNGPIAFAIILLSFRGSVMNEMLWLAVLYATFIVITSSLITLMYRRTGRIDDELYRNELVHQRLFGRTFPAG